MLNHRLVVSVFLLLGCLVVFSKASPAVPRPPSPPPEPLPTYKVVSLNIRYDGGSSDKPELRWWKRKSVVATELRRSDPDLIGLQEVLHNQLRDLRGYMSSYGVIGEGRDGGTRGEHNPIFYKKSRFELLWSDTHWLAPDAPVTPTRAFGAPLRRIFTYARLRDRATNRVIWFFNTHFSHGSGSAQERRVRQAEVLHQFISNRARKHRVWNTSFEKTDSWVTTQDISFPFLEPVIVAGDFNNYLTGTGRWDGPLGIMTQPLVDTAGRPLDSGIPLSLLLFNSPWYLDPLRVPTLSTTWNISSAYSTMKSARLENAALQSGQSGDPLLSLLSLLSLDWILFNEGFSLVSYQSISNTQNASGAPYQNPENHHPVVLSDVHELIYAKFALNQDRSGTGHGINIVAPPFFGKSYFLWPLPLSFYYTFDQVVPLNLVP